MLKIVCPICCGMDVHKFFVVACIVSTKSLILSAAEKYLPQLNLVMKVPDIQSFAAVGIVSEIGGDMSVFPTSKHLCSWAGLTLQNNESAARRNTRISRAGACIKPPLVRCALCAIRAKQFHEVRNRYLSLKKASRKKEGHHFHCQNAVNRHLHIILKKNKPYNPELCCKVDSPPAHREISMGGTTHILQRRGYLVTAPPIA